MTNETFELFFAMLSVATLAGTIVVLASRTVLRSTAFGGSLVDGFRPFARPLSAAIATTCMLGSLYFSEIVNYKPCRLCWYQRGAMYPLAILLIIFTVLKTPRIARTVVPIATIGAGISLYHWLLERFPDNLDSGVCSKDVPCEFVWFELFGFVTLPFMALTGFLAIIVFNTLPSATE
jgi:disulfide bond formation protein DsbB